MDPNVIAELLNRYTQHPKQKRHDYISFALIDALADHFTADCNCNTVTARHNNACSSRKFDRAEWVRIATGSA